MHIKVNMTLECLIILLRKKKVKKKIEDKRKIKTIQELKKTVLLKVSFACWNIINVSKQYQIQYFKYLLSLQDAKNSLRCNT